MHFKKFLDLYNLISTTVLNCSSHLQPQHAILYKIISYLLINKVQHMGRQQNGFTLRKLNLIIFYLKPHNQQFTDKRIGKGQVCFYSRRISLKVSMETAIFCQHLPPLLNIIHNQFIACLCFKRILLIFLVSGCSQMGFGKLYQSMDAFL